MNPPEQVLRPPHGEIPASFWELHGWQVVLISLALLIVVGLVIARLRRPKLIVPELPVVIARRALEALRGRAGDTALAAEVSHIIRRYVRAVLEFPPGELTTTEFRAALQSHPQLVPELGATIGDFLRRCDEWKFAPAPPAQPDVVREAVELVEKIEVSRKPAPTVGVAA